VLSFIRITSSSLNERGLDRRQWFFGREQAGACRDASV